MEDTLQRDDEEIVWKWRRDELERLGFSHKQRGHLLTLIENGELTLHDVQHPIDDLGWTVEQAWWAVC